MSLQWRADNKRWRIRFKRTNENGELEDIRVTLDLDTSERAAKKIEQAVMAAVKFHDYRYLDDHSRRICIQLFKNRGWTLPPALINAVGNERAAEELTLIRGIEYTLSDPEVLRITDPTRYEHSFAHVLAYWGDDFPVKDIQIRHIKEYMRKREKEGASGSTVNKERGALSKMFKVLIEANILDRNPVRDTRPADEKSGQRDVYISYEDFGRIAASCPYWAQVIFQTLYMTGMRRGEALSLLWEDVDLDARIIRLCANRTKERRPKRVPIHKELLPILQTVGEANSFSGRVFRTAQGRTPHEDSLKKPWRGAIENVGLQPLPRIHDLRHCWKTNAMRSGLHPLIADAVVGHGDRKKDVKSLYLTINDADLVREIDRLTFDNGKTENWSQK